MFIYSNIMYRYVRWENNEIAIVYAKLIKSTLTFFYLVKRTW